MISSRVAISQEAVAAHYDELDHFYREVWGDHVHHGLWLRGDESPHEAVLQLTELVMERAGLTPGASVCDIGCGYGATAELLAARGADVTGITVSSTQLAVAKQRPGPNLEFVLADWLHNELPENSFEAAIAIESSEHMPDLRAFFEQAYRVLQPGGRLIVCAWLAAENPGPRARRWLLEPICREGRMPHLGSATDYQRLGERAGFGRRDFEDITSGVARTWPAIVRRLAAKLVTDPPYIRYLFDQRAKNRIFGLTILRIWLAYKIGAMRYGIFTFVKR